MGVECHTDAIVLPCSKLGALGPQEAHQVPSRALLGSLEPRPCGHDRCDRMSATRT